MTRFDVGDATQDVADHGHVLGEDRFGCVADQRAGIGDGFRNA
jgi:hypothetical protein